MKGDNMRMKSFVWFIALMLIPSAFAWAAALTEVHGVVLDPMGSPIKGAQVTLRTQTSAYARTDMTNESGEFFFTGVESGEYTVSVEAAGFVKAEKQIRVVSGSAPQLRFQLEIPALNVNVEAIQKTDMINPETPTPTTLISREQIQRTPGAARSNSVRVITSYVPGSYMIHNQLHVHGGHQVAWLVDGVPIPSTNTGVDVGTPFYINDIDYLEAQRGSYSVEYGDRTYGIFSIIPRTGLGSKRECQLALIYGNFNLTDNFISCADQAKLLAYYASLHGFRTDYGLATPGPMVLNDKASGFGGFLSLIFSPNQRNQFRFMTSFERDSYQVPNDPEAQAAGIRDSTRQRDVFTFLTWVYTPSSRFVLTVSPYFHFVSGQFRGGPNDQPLIPRDERSSNYFGVHAVATAALHRHLLKMGFYGFLERDNNFFGLQSTDGSGINLEQRVKTNGQLAAFFIGDQYRPFEGMSLTGGVRFTYFKGAITETAVDPRIGLTFRIPRLNWVLHGFYGRYYQEPPLSTVSGPLLEFAVQNGFSILPLRGERDEEHQFGITIPLKKWWFDAEYYRTGAKNFLDHVALGTSNIFFPATIDRARIRGFDVSLSSPRIAGRLRLSLIYARLRIEGQGGVSGGLTDFSFSPDYFFLDHDQRNTLTFGSFLSLPRDFYLFTEVRYGSGFLNGEGPDHLPGRTRLDLGGGKKFGKNWSVTINALNVTNGSYLLDNAPLFGGTHWVDPRQIWGELRYSFRY